MKFSLTILLLSLGKILLIFGFILSFAYVFNHEYYPQDLNPWLIPISSTLIFWLGALLLNYHINSILPNTKTPGGLFIKVLDWGMGLILLLIGFINNMTFSSSITHELIQMFDGLYLTALATATTYSIVRVFFLSRWLNYREVPNEKIIQYGVSYAEFLILPGQKFFFMPTMLWWSKLKIISSTQSTNTVKIRKIPCGSGKISFDISAEFQIKNANQSNVPPKVVRTENLDDFIDATSNFLSSIIYTAKFSSEEHLMGVVKNRLSEYGQGGYIPLEIKKIIFEKIF